MAIEIEIGEAYQELVLEKRLRETMAAVLTSEDVEGDVTIVITDNDVVADLNRRFLGIDGPTDVLSFPADDTDENLALPPDTEPYLGDIVIACHYVIAQAQAHDVDLADELDLLVVHGGLHLLGYDHANPADKAIMWAKQDAILDQLRAT